MYKTIITYIASLIISSMIFISDCRSEEIIMGTIKDLKPLAQDLKSSFEEDNPNIIINFITGKESELIEIFQSPDTVIDMIFLDNKYTLEELSKQNFINKNSIKELGKDQLCVVVKKSIEMRAFMLYPKTSVMKGLIISNPSITSLGKYTKEALNNLNLWEKAAKKIIFFENNNDIASTVSRGNYDGGIMYCSFAKRSFIQISDYLNPKLHKPIIYSSGINIEADSNSAIYKFNQFLSSPKAKSIFKKYAINI